MKVVVWIGILITLSLIWISIINYLIWIVIAIYASISVGLLIRLLPVLLRVLVDIIIAIVINLLLNWLVLHKIWIVKAIQNWSVILLLLLLVLLLLLLLLIVVKIICCLPGLIFFNPITGGIVGQHLTVSISTASVNDIIRAVFLFDNWLVTICARPLAYAYTFIAKEGLGYLVLANATVFTR